MKALTGLAASGALLLIAALPAAGQTISPHASGAPTQLAAEGDFGAKKDEYVQRSKAEMQDWRKKIDEFGDTAEAKGHEADAAAKSDLQAAWVNAEAESRKLATASADAWDDAKASFEKASQNLKDTWQKNHPDGK
jgi:gas vesicle protein